MKTGENNYIQRLQLHNEDALICVIEAYITLLDNGEKNLCLEVMERKPEEKRKQIASVEFQVEP